MVAICNVGRHHPCGTFCEGLGHRYALPAAAPTDRALVCASQVGVEPLTDRIVRAPCGLWASVASSASVLDA